MVVVAISSLIAISFYPTPPSNATSVKRWLSVVPRIKQTLRTFSTHSNFFLVEKQVTKLFLNLKIKREFLSWKTVKNMLLLQLAF